MPTWLQNLLKWLFPPNNPTPPLPPISPTPPTPPVVIKGKKSLWSATVNGYPQGATLDGCNNDGKNLGLYLGVEHAFTVHRLIDGQVTSAGLENFWRRAVQETGPNDVTVLHFSGHGANGPSGLPNDPGQNIVTVELRPFYASRIGRILDEEYRGGTVIVLLDCCHSEHGVRMLDPWRDERQPKTIPWSWLDTSQDPLPTVAEARNFNLVALARSPGNGIIEFAACQANDVTWDARIHNPISGQMETQGCATRAWIDAATILDQDMPQGYTVAEFQEEVRKILPNSLFPNQPQLWAAENQLDQLMWRTP